MSVAASFATTAITLRAVTAGAYGYIGLVVTLAALLPFADLGLGAAIQSAAAEARDVRTDAQFERVLLSAFRLLLLSGLTIVAVAVVVAIAGDWPTLLGVRGGGSMHADVVVPVVLTLFAIGLPLGMGQRILIGIERNDLAVLLAVLAPLLSLVSVIALSSLAAPAEAYMVVQPVAALATTMLTLVVASGLTGGAVRRTIRRAIRRRFKGAAVGRVATPMFVVMVGLPVALQSDRVVLAHRGGPIELTRYTLAAQVYAAAWSVLYAAGISLWPRFLRERATEGSVLRSWGNAVKAFSVAGLLVGVLIFALLPIVARVVSGGSVRVSLVVAGSFAALVAVQSSHLPSGMLLSSPSALRFQAACVLLMVMVNLPLSWTLAGSVGAAGPVIGSAVAIFVAQLVPCWYRAFRQLRSSEVQPGVQSPVATVIS